MVHATILGIDERSVVFCIMYMELSVLPGWLIVPSPTLQFDFITGNNTIRTYGITGNQTNGQTQREEKRRRK